MAPHPRIMDLAFEVRGIPPIAMLLLIVMARLGNSTAQCFASQETLADRCCCSVKTVGRLLKRLRKADLVTRIPNPKGSTDRYVLNYHRWCPEGGQNGRGKRPNGPVTAGQGGRQNPNRNPKVNQGGAAVRPERSRSSGTFDSALQQTLDRVGAAVERAYAAEEGEHE